MFSTLPRPFSRICDACYHIVNIYLECDIKLDVDAKDNKKYVICSDCWEPTLKEIEKINNISLDEMPLYITCDNLFIQNTVKKRLKNEIYHP